MKSKQQIKRIQKLESLAQRAGLVILRTGSGFKLVTEDGERLTPSLSAGNCIKWLEREHEG